MIKPTIGRVVWYWPGIPCPQGGCRDPEQPYKADIVFVHSDTVVSVAGYDHLGRPFFNSLATLWEGEGHGHSPCWQWMPYQKGQAARAEKAEQQLDQVVSSAVV